MSKVEKTMIKMQKKLEREAKIVKEAIKIFKDHERLHAIKEYIRTEMSQDG